MVKIWIWVKAESLKVSSCTDKCYRKKDPEILVAALLTSGRLSKVVFNSGLLYFKIFTG
jgi:hypothetical protein